MAFEATRESLETHQIPDWYHDDKLGIFIHWGLFSVPAWAPRTDKDIVELFAAEGMEAIKKTPYAEWYLNSMQFKDCPTWKHHVDTYGADHSYYDFQASFETESAKMQPDTWADLFAQAGARYVVMVTKHHDGYLLWPSQHRNPVKPNLQSKRDLVGDVTHAVRARNLRMGFYYSGVFDWSIFHPPIGDAFNFLLCHQQEEPYARYADRHFRELIERYQPSILWNDIGSPPDFDTEALIADYYNTIPEGVVNDRWSKRPLPKDPAEREALKAFLLSLDPETAGSAFGSQTPDCHWDFSTPEYASYEEAKDYKWEATRGIGRSFGYCRHETDADMISSDELIRSFVDIVSKNGNLLLNVGPMADGTIPEMQQQRLRDLGAWMTVNGEAIYGSRPWTRSEGRTDDGIDVRFTSNKQSVYLCLMAPPRGSQVTVLDLTLQPGASVQLLGHNQKMDWKQESDRCVLNVPAGVKEQPVHVFRIDRK